MITNYIDAFGFYVCVGARSSYSDYGVEIESFGLPSSPRLLRRRIWGIFEATMPPRDLSSMSASGRGLGILEASVFFGGCKENNINESSLDATRVDLGLPLIPSRDARRSAV